MNLFNRLLIICSLFIAGAVFAQNQPTNSPQFTLNFSVLNGPLGTAGADIGATYGVTANALLRADNLLFPAVNGQYFGGGLQYALPTCGLLAKTTLNCEKLQVYATGSGGVSRITIGTEPGVNHLGGMVGGGANYDPTGTGKFTVNLIDFHLARLPGMAPGVTAIASVGVNLGWGTNQSAVAQNVAKRQARLKKERLRMLKLQKAAESH